MASYSVSSRSPILRPSLPVPPIFLPLPDCPGPLFSDPRTQDVCVRAPKKCVREQLFQLTAGNAWIGELPAYNDDGHLDPGVVTYLVSYIVIVNWTLLQVTVAVLLDNFVSGTAPTQPCECSRRQEA
eukprot:3131113-Rhodomonas_salina.1